MMNGLGVPLVNIPRACEQSRVRGLDRCPAPANDPRVDLAMMLWGQYQWANRDHTQLSGFPSTNPLALDWGLGRADDFEYVSSMPATVEIAHQLLMDIGEPVAVVVAWGYWAKPRSFGIASGIDPIAHMASGLLTYKVTRVDVERWIAAISGAVMCTFGDMSIEELSADAESGFIS